MPEIPLAEEALELLLADKTLELPLADETLELPLAVSSPLKGDAVLEQLVNEDVEFLRRKEVSKGVIRSR